MTFAKTLVFPVKFTARESQLLDKFVRLAELIEQWISKAESRVWPSVSACGMVEVSKQDKVLVSRVSDTYLGFIYHYKSQVSTEGETYRHFTSASFVYYVVSAKYLHPQQRKYSSKKETMEHC